MGGGGGGGGGGGAAAGWLILAARGPYGLNDVQGWGFVVK